MSWFLPNGSGRSITCGTSRTCLTAAAVLSLVGFSAAQARGGVDPRAGAPLVTEVLSKAQLSGSLEYTGACDRDKPYLDFPRLHWPADHRKSSLEFLQAMFDVDPQMRVSQDENGMIRMIETDVPDDILDVKIHHLAFFPANASESDPVHGTGMALIAILESPEVVAFGKAHHIEGLPDPDKSRMMPGNCCGGGRIVQGELDDVSVSQALDYMLRTFPGFWTYENCSDPRGERAVVFRFYQNLPATAYKPKSISKVEKE